MLIPNPGEPPESNPANPPAAARSSPGGFDLAAILSGEGENAVDDEADLVPARMLNEFTYCPRLAYLEWIQGEFRDNLDTREGTFGHRNVDRPSKTPFEAPVGDDEGEPSLEGLPSDNLAARALMLSAPSEGLLAKLDLIELDGRRAVPIDYKRGSIPDIPQKAWEPERVQLCAQGLILRANGYDCDHGELYYIESRKRVRIDFDDTLILRTRQLVGQLQELARSRRIPPPLIDSPKCPRCSLVGICLPDETNLLREDSTTDEHRDGPSKVPRKLLPARDDGLPLFVQEQGTYVGKDGDRLKITPLKSDPIYVPLIQVSRVSVLGGVQVTAAALKELANRNIPVCHFSYGGWFTAMTTGMSHKNVELRMAQSRAAFDPELALPLARGFIVAKIRNSRTLLRRHAAEEHKADLDRLAESTQRAERANSRESLLGIEGMAAKTYFAGFARLLRGGETFQLESRNRRPPTDPINALLSFVYALLTREMTITLQSVGFDPFLGFLHQPRYGRPSLALDLAEEFRPLIADSVVLTLVNNEEVSARSFISRAGSVALTDAGRKAVIAGFERRMETEVTHPIFGYRISYRRVLEVQARLLSRVLLGELESYPGFCTR
ncbi:MAG: CRISPR-associated endonuclease Cas1 [Planctomycetaceae bacterium]|nr:CRISPR-associated endonuclease Cas1 [Planctomycetaceae bacterium]